jgi:hypothetical protein
MANEFRAKKGLRIDPLENLSGKLLQIGDNDGLIDASTIDVSGVVTTETLDASGVPYSPYNETYYSYVNPAVATEFDDVKAALDGNSYQSSVAFQTSRNLSSTGVIEGGEIGVVDSTTIYVSGGRGVIVDHETLSGPSGGAAAATLVQWDSFTATVPNITGSDFSVIALDSTGTPYWKESYFTPEEHRDYLILGKVIHRDGINDFTSNLQHVTVDVYNQFVDFAEAVGSLNLNGNIISEHDASNTLEITKSAGSTFRLNYDAINNIKNPHQSTETLQDPATFFRVYRDGSGGWTYVSGQTEIDPDNYDDGTGTLAVTDNNKFTIQRIYMFPGSGRLYVFYGQSVYSSLDKAKERALNDMWDGPPGNFFDATLRAYLIVQEGITNFSDPTSYTIINGGKFQGSVGGGGAASLITTFSDLDFAIYYDAQPDKALSFDLSNLDATGEEIIISANASQNGDITLTLPSESGQLALDADVTALEVSTSGITGGLTQLDGRYVNVTGDTMTGQLIQSDATSPAENDPSVASIYTQGGVGVDGDVVIDGDVFFGILTGAGGAEKSLKINGSDGTDGVFTIIESDGTNGNKVCQVGASAFNLNNTGGDGATDYKINLYDASSQSNGGNARGESINIGTQTGEWRSSDGAMGVGNSIQPGYQLYVDGDDAFFSNNVEVEGSVNIDYASNSPGLTVINDAEGFKHSTGTIASFMGADTTSLRVMNKDRNKALVMGDNASILYSNVDMYFRFGRSSSTDFRVFSPVLQLNVGSGSEEVLVPNGDFKVQTGDAYIETLTPSLSGNYLTWDSTGKLVNGGTNPSAGTLSSTTEVISGGYTVTSSDFGNVLYAATSGTITLPSSPTTDAHMWIKNKTSSSITINGNGNNIEEESTNVITAKASIHIHFDGTEWWVI